VIEIGGVGPGNIGTAGVHYDQIVLTGAGNTFTAGGATLQILPIAGIVNGATYTMVSAEGGAEIDVESIFAGLTEIGIDTNIYEFGVYQLEFTAGAIFITIPEPASIAGWLVFGGVLLARRKGRTLKRSSPAARRA
jgi:hypothetical protein